ncbi:f-box-like domain-containing protein [Ditylenchus destructor]|nr:f-box-like domain-containing protein [Ditylenchus destructor]
MDAISNINELPGMILAQIFEKLPWEELLKIEQVCKNWQHVGKNLSWSNYRIFDNFEYRDRPEAKQIKTFLERCGRHLRHLTLYKWSSQTVLSFIRMAPNVQHLRFCNVMLNDEFLKELAEVVPGLKSLAFKRNTRCKQYPEYNLGLILCFKAMTRLEYLDISDSGVIFKGNRFGEFPPNLKYLALDGVSDAAEIISWVATRCKDLRGLRLSCDINENTLQAISQLKNLTYLSLRRTYSTYISYNVIFEALTELRAIQIDTIDEKVLTAIARHCEKLEHLRMFHNPLDEISPKVHAPMMRLASLPNLCSLSIRGGGGSYSKEHATEFVNRLIANGKLQNIELNIPVRLEPEMLFEILRRCKSIRYINLVFCRIGFSDLYPKACQVVDEIDESERQQRELTGVTHPVVDSVGLINKANRLWAIDYGQTTDILKRS